MESDEIDLKRLEELYKDIENKKMLNNKSEQIFKKDDFKTVKDITYHFKQSIERIWNIIKNFELMMIINNLKHYPCIIKKGVNTWSEGNIFEGKLFGLYAFQAKVIKEKSFPEIKKCEKIFYLEKGEILKLHISLYKVTEDDSCVLYWRSSYIPKYGNNIILQIKSRFNGKKLFKKVEDILEEQPIDLYQYESGIIPGKMENIWEILTDNSKLVSIAPNNKCFVPININNVNPEEIVNVIMNIKGIEGKLIIKLDLKEQNQGWNKWIFGYSVLGGEPFKVPKQSIYVQLTKINDVETQLSIFTTIYDAISNDMFKHLSNKKKYVISSLKDYFENFYCPPKGENNNEL